MPHSYNTSRAIDSEVCPGVQIVLKRMTEGRRLQLRKLIAEPNRRILDIMRQQDEIQRQPEDSRDMVKFLSLSDEYDEIMLTTINPAWLTWGCKSIQNLESDGRMLGVEDWQDWPSVLFQEVLSAVRAEAELNGAEKNAPEPSQLRSTSGGPELVNQKLSPADSAEKRDGFDLATAPSTIPN